MVDLLSDEMIDRITGLFRQDKCISGIIGPVQDRQAYSVRAVQPGNLFTDTAGI